MEEILTSNLEKGISKWFADLNGVYTAHPKWITPEGLQLLVSNFKYLTPEEQVSYRNYT